MTQFSSKPVRIRHIECGATWEMYAIEWPPKVVVCTNCKTGLKLVGYDEVTKHLSYRRA